VASTHRQGNKGTKVALEVRFSVSSHDAAILAGEHHMSQFEQGKKIADKAATTARDTWNKGQAATEQTAQAAQESFSATADSVRDFNLKVLEMARTNSNAFFDFALEVAGTKEPTQLMELWAQHARKQFETMGKQSQELTSMGQKLASASAEPLSRSFDT
jgi:hypothetical protein